MGTRKNPSAAFYVCMMLTLALLYGLAFGPACWLNERTGTGTEAISVAFRPILALACDNCSFSGRVVRWYANVGATRMALVIDGHVVWDNPWAFIID
jgi:hypothetical protein